MDVPAAPRRPSRMRHLVKIKLRLLLILIPVVAISIARVTNRIRAQRRAVEMIHRAGGMVCYDFQRTTYGMWDPKLTRPAPWPFLGWLPEECFQEVTLISLPRTAVGVDEMQKLAGLENVEYLSLSGTRVTDAG